MQHSPTSTHRSLQRAIAILREFSETQPALTVSDISRSLGLHKSTVSRILGTLLEEGMVWHNPDSGRYSLGMALVGMAGVALGQIDVRTAAIPHMEQLAAVTNETIALAVRRDRESVTVAHLPSTHSIRHVLWIGRRLPLGTTATGKALLAPMHARGEDWRKLVEPAKEDRSTEWETTLRSDLASIARRGYAEEADEFEIGTAAIAAPILNQTGAAVAALSVSGPSARFDTEIRTATASVLIETADAVASDLGLRWPATSQVGAHGPSPAAKETVS
ncbi:MAG: IclR family transcriptional regulator [Acidimicrobiia bacterium]|nr:MAG: IclR family transcriptional regulator [Acidimicrobiia bacterium]